MFPYGPSLKYYGCGACSTSTCSTPSPTINPSTNSLSKIPSQLTSQSPSISPSKATEKSPSTSPSVSPISQSESASPSKVTAQSPSGSPSVSPSQVTTQSPSRSPSFNPSKATDQSPSVSPSKTIAKSPSVGPSKAPSVSPSRASSQAGSPGGSQSTTAPVLINPNVINDYYLTLHNSAWLLNKNGDYSSLFSSKTDIVNSSQSGYQWKTTSYVIPKYNYNFTASVIATLNSRPKASSDFSSGSKTTAVANKIYTFGTDIGYSGVSCTKKYWPPGPSCKYCQ